jgi:hypothetical protein
VINLKVGTDLISSYVPPILILGSRSDVGCSLEVSVAAPTRNIIKYKWRDGLKEGLLNSLRVVVGLQRLLQNDGTDCRETEERARMSCNDR